MENNSERVESERERCRTICRLDGHARGAHCGRGVAGSLCDGVKRRVGTRAALDLAQQARKIAHDWSHNAGFLDGPPTRA